MTLGSKIEEFLYANPATAREIGDFAKRGAVVIHNYTNKFLIPKGRVCKISAGYSELSNRPSAVYYLPGDEEFAWIKYRKLHGIAVQKQLDLENKLLQDVSEQGLVHFSPKGLFKQYYGIFEKLCRTGIVRKLNLDFYPSTWCGPSYFKNYHYVLGNEKAAAKKLASWLPKWDSLSSGERVSIGHILKGLPFKLDLLVRQEIGAVPVLDLTKQKQKRTRGRPYKSDVVEPYNMRNIYDKTLYYRTFYALADSEMQQAGSSFGDLTKKVQASPGFRDVRTALDLLIADGLAQREGNQEGKYFLTEKGAKSFSDIIHRDEAEKALAEKDPHLGAIYASQRLQKLQWQLREIWLDLLCLKRKELSQVEYNNFEIALNAIKQNENYLNYTKDTLNEILDSNPHKEAKSKLAEDVASIVSRLPGATVKFGTKSAKIED